MKNVVACIALLALASSASAGSYSVAVGYADSLRPTGFFPNPWQGGVNYFLGGGTNYDSGAILITNTGGTDITLTNALVNNFRDGTSYQIWGGVLPVTIHAGQNLILTQLFDNNFDSSDNSAGGTPASPSPNIPHVSLTVDGVTTQFNDSAHVLDTLGYDVANFGYPGAAPGDVNESEQWRPIGTFGGRVPEPASLTLLGIGIAGMSVYGWRRKKQQEK